jgi:hypothetical protein
VYYVTHTQKIFGFATKARASMIYIEGCWVGSLSSGTHINYKEGEKKDEVIRKKQKEMCVLHHPKQKKSETTHGLF